MRDTMDCRDWVENHHGFTDDMDRGIGKIMTAFQYLARYNFSAPWNNTSAAKARNASC